MLIANNDSRPGEVPATIASFLSLIDEDKADEASRLTLDFAGGLVVGAEDGTLPLEIEETKACRSVGVPEARGR